jgi:predicted O-methyltransferase YrrM
MSKNGKSPLQRVETRLREDGYDFTGLWFYKTASRIFRRHFRHYSRRPTKYVEIGIYEGCSACWVCENILAHPDSRGWGIDSWRHPARDGSWSRWNDDEMQMAKIRAISNIYRFRDKFTILEGDSPEVLRSGFAEDGTIDLIYVDGSHFPEDIKKDVIAAWPLLKKNGVMVFDDCNRPEVAACVKEMTMELMAQSLFFERTHAAVRKV